MSVINRQQKNYALKMLAQLLMNIKPGEKLPPVRQLARTLGLSLGTISETLADIERNRAILLERRGRHGMFLAKKDVGKLWALGETRPLVISFPLPSSTKIEGLATAVKKLFTDSGMEVFLIFVRGARQRLRALRQETCHLAVMSEFASSELCGDMDKELVKLPEGSYISEHRVYYFNNHSPGSDRVLKVGYDPDSIDQHKISEMEFDGMQVEWIKTTYMEFPRMFAKGYIDTAVWTYDEMEGKYIPGLQDRPLSGKVTKLISGKDKSAVFVGRAGDLSVKAAANEVLVPESLMRIQQDVMSSLMVPEY